MHLYHLTTTSGRFLRPRLELFESADVLAVDENLRNCFRPRYGADHFAARGVRQRDLGILIAKLLEQRFGARTVLATLARENRYLVRQLRRRVDVREHGVGVGYFERIAGLLRLD